MEKQKIFIYDHNTHPIWAQIYKTRFEKKGRTNGAYTYSQDIVNYHIPVIIEAVKKSTYKNVLICTVNILEDNIIPDGTDLIVYYLHENSLREIPRILKINEYYKGKIIYIAARQELVNKIKNIGLPVVHLPLSIDVKEISKFYDNKKYDDKRVIYFGNKYLEKDNMFLMTKNLFIKKGFVFDELSNNEFNNNGVKLSREEILKILAKYKYGIGEGRCFLEMNALGIKTIICCSQMMGMITSEAEFENAKTGNFSKDYKCNFSNDLRCCIDNIDKIMIKSNDVSEVLGILKEGIENELR